MMMPPGRRSPRLVLRAAGFMAMSASGSSPGVMMSSEEKEIWKPETPGREPRGARISAGKSGNVEMSLPKSAVALVNCVPATCMPSLESPAKRMVTRDSSRISCFSSWRTSVVMSLSALWLRHSLVWSWRDVEHFLREQLGEVAEQVAETHQAAHRAPLHNRHGAEVVFVDQPDGGTDRLGAVEAGRVRRHHRPHRLLPVRLRLHELAEHVALGDDAAQPAVLRDEGAGVLARAHGGDHVGQAVGRGNERRVREFQRGERALEKLV